MSTFEIVAIAITWTAVSIAVWALGRARKARLALRSDEHCGMRCGCGGAALAVPREHCGQLSPETLLTTPRTECVLRPGHSGSHADEVGCRWWPIGEE